MKMRKKFSELLDTFRDAVATRYAAVGVAMTVSPALAWAQTDPGATAVAEIDKGKGYGIAAAVALVAAAWAITAVYMAGRKR